MDLSQLSQDLLNALGQKVLGQQNVLEEAVITVLCQGHALLTGSPGVAKTTLVRNLASVLGCGHKRIQFTPDLTPYDILGGETLQFDEHRPEIRRLVFQPGPIFTSFLLADEINRASPRTQAALLEAMQEKQVSGHGQTRKLPQPFYVFATQNPIENEGTFPLPEAQLDRFLLNIEVPYPTYEAEIKIAEMSAAQEDLVAKLDASVLLNLRPMVEKVPMDKMILEGIVNLVRNSRPESTHLSLVKEEVAFGASPRASQALKIASQAAAILSGDAAVSWKHVQRMAPAVLRHRMVLGFKALSRKRTPAEIIAELLKETIL
jgi:MoxR-like ATPase